MYLTFFIVNTSRTHLEHYRYGATTCLTMYFKELDKKTHWWVPVVLGRCGFFALGNSHLISTIDIAGAYTGVSSFSIWVRRSLSKKKKVSRKKNTEYALLIRYPSCFGLFPRQVQFYVYSYYFFESLVMK